MKNIRIQLAVLIAVLHFGLSLQAAARVNLSNNPAVQIMPIVGYETVYRDSPTPHTSTRLIYGASVTYGVPYLSGEAEYTRANDIENYVTAPQSIKNEDENLKLGIRSNYNLTDFAFVSGRLGGQATQGTVTTTSSGVSTSTKKDLQINPYAGVGLGAHLGSLVTLSAQSTLVFRDYKDMKKNDIQNTVALSIGIN